VLKNKQEAKGLLKNKITLLLKNISFFQKKEFNQFFKWK